MRLIRIFKCILNIKIQHLLRGLTGQVATIRSSSKPQHPESHKGKSKLLKDMAYIMSYALQVAIEIDSFKPTTYQEAISCFKAKEWMMAMNEEMESL